MFTDLIPEHLFFLHLFDSRSLGLALSDGHQYTHMTISLVSNVSSLRAANSLQATQKNAVQSMQRISSGTRLNSAGSDAAGGAVATKLRSKIASTQQALRNSNDGISILQTAEGSAKEVANILERSRELATQAASGTLSNDERTHIVTEMKELTVEVGRIADSLEFNGKELGSGASLQVQVGANHQGSTNIIKFKTMDLKAIGTTLKTVDVSTEGGARIGLKQIDINMDALNQGRASMGAAHTRLESALNTASESLSSITAATSRIADTDYAHETAQMAANQVKMSAGAAALGQAQSMSASVMSLI